LRAKKKYKDEPERGGILIQSAFRIRIKMQSLTIHKLMGTVKQKNVIEIKSDTDFIASDQQLSFDDFLKTIMQCWSIL
jgi:translation elongation factor EF-Ts